MSAFVSDDNYGEHPLFCEWCGRHLPCRRNHPRNPIADRARAEVQAAVVSEVESWQHETVEDCWYSCGLTHDTDVENACCNDAVAGMCTCSTGYRQERIKAALGDTAALDRMLAEARAEAWDEGRDAGHEEARCVNPEYPARARNPYRAEGEGAT